jgi:hypothetical protein
LYFWVLVGIVTGCVLGIAAPAGELPAVGGGKAA